MPVTRFEVTLRRPLAGGRAFGDVGRYEELVGRLHMAVDPRHAANRAITDAELAPRDADGRVAFAADVSILLPLDRGRMSGRFLLHVVNRGNTVTVPNFNHATRPAFEPGSDPHPPIDVGDGWLMRRGWVVVSCGLQCDLPPRAPDVRPLTGRVFVQLQAPVDVPDFLLSDRGHDPYEAADLDEPGAVLVVSDQPDGPAGAITRNHARFSRVDGERVIPDARHIYLAGGFAKGRIYQLAYTAVGARVLGLGMAALRDRAAWLKHGSAGEGHAAGLNAGSAAEGRPAAGALRHGYAYGRSQTGRLLRTMIHHDLNADEAGRRALDGIIAHVAGGMPGGFQAPL